MAVKIADLPIPKPQILPSPEGYAVDTGAYKARFKALANAVNTVEFETQGKTFVWESSDLAFVNAEGIKDYIFMPSPAPAEVSGDTLIYNRSYPDVDDRFIAYFDRLKHDIILQQCPRTPAEYIGNPAKFAVEGFISIPEGVEVWADEALQTGNFITSGAITFKHEGQDLWQIPTLTMKDANGEDGVGQYEVEQTEQGIVLRCLVDYAWLQGASYPVEIDPTITITNNSVIDIEFSPNRGDQIFRTNDGTLWIVVHKGHSTNQIDFFKSVDNGINWSFVTTLTNTHIGQPFWRCAFAYHAGKNLLYIALSRYTQSGDDAYFQLHYAVVDFTNGIPGVLRKGLALSQYVDVYGVISSNPTPFINFFNSSGRVVIAMEYNSGLGSIYYSDNDFSSVPTSYTNGTQFSSANGLYTMSDTELIMQGNSGFRVIDAGSTNYASNLHVQTTGITILDVQEAGVGSAVCIITNLGSATTAVPKYMTITRNGTSLNFGTQTNVTSSLQNGSSRCVGLTRIGAQLAFVALSWKGQHIYHDAYATYPVQANQWDWAGITSLKRNHHPITVYSVSSHRNGIVMDIIVSYTSLNAAPNAPVFTSPAHATGYTLNRRPQFKVTVSDPDSNPITSIELDIATDTGFTTGKQTFTFNGSWASGSTVTLPPTSDVTLGTRYCRVRAYDGTEWGNYSGTLQMLIENETTFWTFPTASIAVNDAGVRIGWLTEARTAINNARSFRGQSAPSWTDPSPTVSTDIRATHITELRSNLQGALTQVGVTATWTDPTIVAGTTDRKGAHWVEVRNYLKQI